MVEGVDDRGDLVVDRDPAHVLAAGTDPAAEADSERGQHPAQHATVGAEDDPGPDRDEADPDLGGRLGARLPPLADLDAKSFAAGCPP